MAVHDSILSKALRSPVWVWAVVLSVVFAVEIVVMYGLSFLDSGSIGNTAKAFIDAVLLTIISAPILWYVIIAPLRHLAIREFDRSQTIVSNASAGILTFGSDGIISSCNAAAAALFDIGPIETIGSHVHSILPELSWVESGPSHQQPTKARKSDGSLLSVQVSIGNLPSDNSSIAIIRDLTESEKSEKQKILQARETEALRAQQMATLAQLATGVAHEIRNPLTAIKMMIQVNRDRFAVNGLPVDDLELIEQEIRRIERSVSSLLEYARPEKTEFAEFALQDVIQKTTRLVAGQCASQNVALILDLPDELIFVCGDSSQIQQLLLNLCLNALDEMPGGGTLKITGEIHGEEAVVAVVDTGDGIREDVLDNLFSPFVTTKPNGIGLGLGICRRIAESHAGRLEGVNTKNGGAAFQLSLPLINQPTCFQVSEVD